MKAAASDSNGGASSSEVCSPSPAAAMTLLEDRTKEPMLNYDGTAMRNEDGLVHKSQFLSTHPIWSDCRERVGYGGRKLTYVSGDGVIRTMNAIFGNGGWSTKLLMERVVLSEKDERGRWNVGYLASVRVTISNGNSHEDCGSGEGINESKLKAHETGKCQHLTRQIVVGDSPPQYPQAMKSAVTDAMKRAARHFGERLGNALYIKGNGIRNAPRTNREALARLEREDALNLFGDQAKLRAKHEQRRDSSQDRTSPTSVTNEVIDTNSVSKQPGQCSAYNAVSRPSSNGGCGGDPFPPPSGPSAVMPSPIVTNQNACSRGAIGAMPGALNQQTFANQTSDRNYYNQHVRHNSNSNGILPRPVDNSARQQQTPPDNNAMPPPGPYNPSRQDTTAARNVHHYGNNNIIHKRGACSSTGQTSGDAKRQRMNPYAGNAPRLSV